MNNHYFKIEHRLINLGYFIRKSLKLVLTMMILGMSLYSSEEAPTKEEIAKLYVATFNRAPDSAGLSYWKNDSGLKLSQIAQSFFDQSEAKEKYPEGSTNSTFIDSIYSNLFNRVSDTDGFNYWKDELDFGRVIKSEFILAVVNGAQGLDVNILKNKTDVGLSYAEAGLNDEITAQEIMLNVTAFSSSVTSVLQSYNLDMFDLNNSVVSENHANTNPGKLLAGKTIWATEPFAEASLEKISFNDSMTEASFERIVNGSSSSVREIYSIQENVVYIKDDDYYDYDQSDMYTIIESNSEYISVGIQQFVVRWYFDESLAREYYLQFDEDDPDLLSKWEALLF